MQLDVSTTSGPVRGRERKAVALFAGIPYAAPPTGDRRWAPPQPAHPWEQPRDATRFGRAAPQLPGDGLTNRQELKWDEDCLFLNVVTPGADDEARPVLVWIHGGGYQNGTGATPWYDGTSFAANGDVVVVTVNYRLGALGFCRMPGESTSGLNGLLDQIAALEWVRDNIANFGGDPARVTIAGESAGAFSVGALLAMPGAQGLFRGAIAQSGAGHHAVESAAADETAQRFQAALGVSGIAEAREASAAAVLEAQRTVLAQPGRMDSTFYPCIDGELLPALPARAMASVRQPVPLLIGTNADEMTLFGLGAVTDDRLMAVLGRYGNDGPDLVDAYRRELAGASAGELACAYVGDHTFRIPAVRLAEARHGRGADTWMYLFNWKSPAFGGALGATHALDIGFTFNTLDAPGFDVFLGEGELPGGLADTMHRAWTTFVHTGDPRTPSLGPWPPYTPDDRAVLEFGEDVRLLDDPGALTRKAWEGLR